ncbi:hypothetical protein [Sinomonas halotolerans]|uniref:Uncharacterized protein n=1 Tax=Sinomonas halotolerans TaxID=1644133 RepID=A0ABU9X2S8_9MICC
MGRHEVDPGSRIGLGVRIDVYGSESVRWLDGNGPRPARRYLGECRHPSIHVVAWGWDFRHYELAQCNNAACLSRAWVDQDANATTQWMEEAGREGPGPRCT